MIRTKVAPMRWYSSEAPRINAVGIQYLSRGLQEQVFPESARHTNRISRRQVKMVKLAQTHLASNDLLGKRTKITEPIDFKLPALRGKTLDEHFYRIGMMSSARYLELVDELIRIGDNLPKQPESWKFESGWYKYVPGEKPVPVRYPEEDALVFDVETLYKMSPYPVMATCVSRSAWYGWVSPYLTGESTENNHLIPLDTFDREKVIVGHNVAYDRARVAQEYNLAESKAFFLDTMSLHVAVSGMCSRQRGTWMKYRKNKQEAASKDEDGTSLETLRSQDISSDGLKDLINNPVLDLEMGTAQSQDLIDDPWMKFSSLNSLKHVADLHCGIKMDKEIRNYFADDNKEVIVERFQELMGYCALDVYATFKVFHKIFPEFKELVAHPVSFAALRHISQSFLPTTKKWEHYISTAEKIYVDSTSKIEQNLHKMAMETVAMKDDPSRPWEKDPWLSQLDWTITPVKLTKSGTPYKNQKLPGYPEWYKSLVVKNELKLTTRSRPAPLLLKLSWDSNPLYWLDTQGWCFVADHTQLDHYKLQNYTHIELGKLSEDPRFDTIPPEYIYTKCFFKVPHNDGPNARAVSIMTKSFLGHFEKGLLTSEFELAKDALQLGVSCSYWTSARERIMNQMVVYNGHNGVDFGAPDHQMGMILPQIVPMGTVTRRAVENTWLTASNAKKSRLGSELKSMIEAPKGYCFVGADVDSEELWIASVVGDSVFQTHGGTAIGWMTLEGSKNEGTDLHSKTANILGISRNEAKVFNYGRIYGAGVKFATTLLKKFNPSMTDEEATAVAKKLYAETKGKTGVIDGRKMWYGGSESIVFNRLERIAESPKTPALNAGITAALTSKNLKANSFLPSRINWAIQSSGVDYLHLLIVSMEYLSKLYGVDARLSITVHDEIRYLVKEQDKYKAAMILQVSNLWTRAMFSSQLGMDELPQSCAFFSAVDIDHVLRKEVDLDCVTPSNPVPIPHGTSLDILELLEKPGMRSFFEQAVGELDLGLDVSQFQYTRKRPIVEELDRSEDAATGQLMVNAQIVRDEKQFRLLKSELRRMRASASQYDQRKQFERDNFEASFDGDVEASEMAGMLQEMSTPLEQLSSRKTPKKRGPTGANTKMNKLLKESSNRGYIYQASASASGPTSAPERASQEEPHHGGQYPGQRIFNDLSQDDMLEAFRR